MDEDLRQRRFLKTKDRAEYIKDKGYIFIEMWECELKKLTYTTPELDQCNIIPPFTRAFPGPVNSEQILTAVKKDELFGVVEVDIEVPHKWSDDKVSRDRTPYDHFSEMSPIFCTSDISFDCIGEHMQQHIEKFNLSKVS